MHHKNHLYSLIRGADAGRYPLPPVAAVFFPRSIPPPPAAPPPTGPPRGRDGGLDVFCRLLLTSPNGPRLPKRMFEPERAGLLMPVVGWDPPDRIFEPERRDDAERGLVLAAALLLLLAFVFVGGFHFLPGSFV